MLGHKARRGLAELTGSEPSWQMRPSRHRRLKQRMEDTGPCRGRSQDRTWNRGAGLGKTGLCSRGSAKSRASSWVFPKEKWVQPVKPGVPWRLFRKSHASPSSKRCHMRRRASLKTYRVGSEFRPLSVCKLHSTHHVWQELWVYLPHEKEFSSSEDRNHASFIIVPSRPSRVLSQQWLIQFVWGMNNRNNSFIHHAQCAKVKAKSLSRVWLFATPWTVACQALQSMGFSRQEYWSGLPFPSPGNLPDPGTEPRSPTLQADALPSEPPGKPYNVPGIV